MRRSRPRAGSGSHRQRRAGRKTARADRDAIAELYARDRSARVVVVAASPEATHDGGSVAVAVARRWAAHGRDVLFVDADACGSALARRLGSATRADFSPAQRGVPSLMAARQRVTADLLEEHCWRLAAGDDGAVRMLLGPTNTAGALSAAGWLARHADELLTANAGRHMIVSMAVPLLHDQEAFLRAASAVVLVAPADTEERFAALRTLGSSLIGAAKRCAPCVVIDGAAVHSYEEIHAVSGMHVAGRLDAMPERVLLGGRTRRRDAKHARKLDELAGRIAFLAADEEHDELDGRVPDRQRPQDTAAVGPLTAAGNPGAQRDGDDTAPLGAPNGAAPLRAVR